jgi:hypothetical protein
MSERHHHGDGYIIVGPFILSFGLVGAFLKGVLIVVAVLAIPAGLAMTVYATYRPARELGNSKRANASAVLTTLGWVMLFTGVAFLFEDAPLKILPWIGGLILLRLPFAWIDPNRRKKPARPLSHVRLLLWRVYVACERAPRWLLLIPGITCVAAWVAFVSLFEKSQTAFVIHSAQDVTSLLLGLPLFAVFFSVLSFIYSCCNVFYYFSSVG